MKTSFTWITLIILLLSGIILTLLPSCDNLQDAAQFKVKYELPDRTFTLDSLSHLKTEQLLCSQSFNANIDSILGANNGLLGGAGFYLLQLSVISPDWVTLNWLNSARITITPSGGVPIEVATTATINPASRTINFEVKNLDIASTVNGPFQIDLYGNLNGPLPAGYIQMLLESGLELTVNPL